MALLSRKQVEFAQERKWKCGKCEAAVISIALTCKQAPRWGAEGVCPIDRAAFNGCYANLEWILSLRYICELA
jgi:hypothetical protein